MPIIEYEIYRYKTREKLELDICQNMEIDLYLPVSIDEDSLFLYDPNSDFYNDICYTYTSENGTDVSLEDRKNEYVENNMTLCEEDCEFNGYDSNTKKALCKCLIKFNFFKISEITIDKTKLYDSFVDLPTVANLWVMKCYTVLFSKDGIKNNIGAYIIIPIIILQIIFIIIFYKRDFSLIKNKINMIIYLKINWKRLNSKVKQNKNKKELTNNNKKENLSKDKKSKEKDEIKKKTKKSNENKYNKNNKNNKKLEIKFELKVDNELLKEMAKNRDKIKNNKKNIKNIPLNIEIDKKIKNRNNKNDNKNTKVIMKKVDKNSAPPMKKNKNKNRYAKKNIIHNLKTNNNNSSSNNRSSLSNNLINNENKLDIINANKNIKIDKQIMNNNDYELNILHYEEALKIDKRTYIEYYFSLLKINHPLFFLFRSNDYNSLIIKIYLLFFSFILYYAINALFFSDSTMHKIYEDGGIFNFIYQIPQILYSSMISGVVHALIRTLSLSEKNVLQIKTEKIMIDLEQKGNKIIKCLYIKFRLFFILSFVLLIFFLYYISCFCAVYNNTQLHLLKDSVISFGLSLLYPFGIYLIPGIFRIPSLRNNKKNSQVLYKISKIVQLI